MIITFIGFKITFSNIMSHGAPLLISRGWRLAPPPGFSKLSQTLGLKGLTSVTTSPNNHPDLTYNYTEKGDSEEVNHKSKTNLKYSLKRSISSAQSLFFKNVGIRKSPLTPSKK